MVCSRDFFVAKIDEFPGNLVGLSRCVASIHTLNRRFHADNSVGWVAESELRETTENREKKAQVCII